jgi:HEAT repeat protein
MSETLGMPEVAIENEPLLRGQVIDLDKERSGALIDTLYKQHVYDYDKMFENKFDKEKTNFLNHLRDTLQYDKNPQVRAAAKRFLEEIGETNE